MKWNFAIWLSLLNHYQAYAHINARYIKAALSYQIHSFLTSVKTDSVKEKRIVNI